MQKYKHLKITLIWNEITKSFIQIKKIINSSKTDGKEHYLSLTPIPDADEDNAYSNMLKFALSQDKIKNIAITGPYGSGKSSVLLTFREQNLQWNYLNISLATFKTPLEGDNVENQKQEVEALEKSILQQLFYSVKQKDIPKSRLKRITSTNKINILALATFIFIWALSFISIFFPDITIIKSFPLLKNKITEYNYIAIFLFTTFSFISLYFLVKYFEIIQELKFKFQDTEITLNNKSNESMLNTYLDEVLYFFERSKVNIVIFEDLDRFNNTEIFIKLRELNELINNSKQVNKHIIFIYAIKDDMFLDKDRSKFFDFIIPIIPVINPTNAYYLIKKSYINEEINKELNNKIEDKFLHQVSLFFDDLRLVTNIFNEFNLYNIKINTSNLNSNKLLALIIYKNYYPKDFSDLHSNSGEIYNLFNIVKNQIIIKISKDIEQELETIESEISKSDKENITSVQDLRKIYIHEIQKRFPIISNITRSYNNFNNLSYSIKLNTENQEVDYLNLVIDDNFDILKNSNSIEWIVNDTSNLSYLNFEIRNKKDLKFSFKDIEKTVDKSQSYEIREINIKNKYSSARGKMLQKKQELKIKNNHINQYTLKEILEENQNEIVFNEEKHPPLLQFLIREGYIDEHYPDYISYFIDSVISIKERDYALSVLSLNENDFELRLNNIDKIISRYFMPRHFNNTSILNFDLLDYIIKNKNLYIEHYSNLFTLLSNNEERSKDFIISYIDRGKNLNNFINSICLTWDNFFEYISTSIMSEEKIDNYLKTILQSVDQSNLEKINKKNLLRSYISHKENFIEYIQDVYNDESDKIFKFLEAVSPTFSYLNCTKNNLEIFNHICASEYFSFNKRMILQIITLNSNDENQELICSKFNSTPYGVIQNFAPNYLKFQIDQSIDHYFEEVLIPSSLNLSECSEFFIKLINIDNLSLENKQWLIKNNNVKISSLIEINEDKLWEIMIKNSRILPNWNSLIQYFSRKEFTIDDTLINYINSPEAYKSLENEKIFDSICIINDEDIGIKFESSLLTSEKFNMNAYNSIIQAHKHSYTSLDISELSNEKTLVLCQNKILLFTDTNLEIIREKSNEVLLEFLSQNKKYILEKLPADLELTIEELELILKSAKFDNKFKKDLVDKLNIELFSKSESIRLLIINLHHQLSVRIPISYIDFYFVNSTSISKKIDLFISQIKYLDQNSITKYLKSFGTPYDEISTPNRHKLNFTLQHDKLTTELELIGYIHRKEIKKYKLADDKIFFYLK